MYTYIYECQCQMQNFFLLNSQTLVTFSILFCINVKKEVSRKVWNM